MPALLITDGGGPTFQLNRTDDIQYYLVYNLTTARSLSTAVSEGLPNVGSTIGTMLVRQARCVETLTQIAPFSEIWAIFATNYIGGSLGNRRSSSVQSEFETTYLPNWKQDTVTGVGTVYVQLPRDDRIPVTRQIIHRIRYKQTSGLNEDTVAAFDATNAGGVLTIGGILYIYEGSTVFTGSDNQQRVVIRYKTKAAVKTIPSGTFPGQSITVPALPVLGEYAIQLPFGAIPPSINVASPTQLYNAAASPPWDI